jgi:esterase/lipase
VRAPALVIHGRRDHTVPFACADALAGGLGAAAEVRRLTLERSFHLGFVDRERTAVANAVGAFLDRHLATAGD